MENAVQQKPEIPIQAKPNNMFIVPIEEDLDFFKQWCAFLHPFTGLTKREEDVMASFLKQRWELSKEIKDPAVLDDIVMSDKVKKKIIDECNITLSHLYVVMSTLRKSKIIDNNSINSKLVPNIRKDEEGIFELRIIFMKNQK